MQSASADCDPLVFQCLQTVNRFELLPVINAYLEAGRPLVFDRYTASAMVYGTLDGLDPDWIELINMSLPQPDVWIYLDIPIEESFKRRPERRDRYESDRAYLEKVREGYLRLFREKAIGQIKTEYAHGWYIVNGLGTVEEVHERILGVIK